MIVLYDDGERAGLQELHDVLDLTYEESFILQYSGEVSLPVPRPWSASVPLPVPTANENCFITLRAGRFRKGAGPLVDGLKLTRGTPEQYRALCAERRHARR